MKINFSVIKLIRKSGVLKGKRYVSLYGPGFLLVCSLFIHLFWAPVQIKVFAAAIVPDQDSSFPLGICSFSNMYLSIASEARINKPRLHTGKSACSVFSLSFPWFLTVSKCCFWRSEVLPLPF